MSLSSLTFGLRKYWSFPNVPRVVADSGSYELLKWEEFQRQRRNEPLRRELEWATIAREIALMNKPYSR